MLSPSHFLIPNTPQEPLTLILIPIPQPNPASYLPTPIPEPEKPRQQPTKGTPNIPEHAGCLFEFFVFATARWAKTYVLPAYGA
jgi:hypothetical protein